EGFGLGVMTETPGLIRSSQSLMPLGFPLRTRKIIVEVYGELLFGRRDCQFAGNSLAFWAMASMSYAKASVTTSASSPSITARACLLDPPCDCWISTVCPDLAFQYFAKAAL